MNNTVSVRQTIKKIKDKLIIGLLGVLLARVSIIADLSPFGTAFVAAVPKPNMSAGLLGVIIGIMLPGGVDNRLRYIASALAVAGIKWALAELRTISRHAAFPPCAALAGILLTGITVTASSGSVMVYDLVVYSAEGLLCAGATFFFAEALGCSVRLKAGRLSAREKSSIIVMAAIAAIPLCQINIAGIAPAAILLMVLVMGAGRERGIEGGAVAGIAVGAVIAVAQGEYALAGICAAAGLMCGLFSMVGKLACAAAFSITCSLAAFGTGNINVFFLIEVLAASSIFPMIRGRMYEALFSTLRERKQPDRLPPEDIPGKLSMAADALSGISQTMDELTEKLGKINEPDPESVCRKAAQEVCEECSARVFCWEDKQERTKKAFDEACEILKSEGTISQSNAPKVLVESCAKSQALLAKLNFHFAEYAARQAARRRTAQIRSVLADHLGGMGGLLYDLADETSAMEKTDDGMCSLVTRALSDAGYCAQGVRCSGGDSGVKITALINDREKTAVPRHLLGAVVGERLGIELCEPDITSCDEGFVIEMCEKPPLRLLCGAAQHSCAGGRLCGDSYDIFTTDKASFMLISDGMGSGGRAAVDSAMTCGLLSRLLKAGFTSENALRIVNAALLIKSDDESLSTADCFKMNLFSGEGLFVKAGSARSFIKHGNCIREIEPKSLPLGILRGADTSSETAMMSSGDIVVMVSDGADDGDCEWLTQELIGFDGEPSALAKNLLALACARRSGKHDDDITVLAAMVSDNKMSA
ncbi:MAG: SpoIIE family protein phosphatase [Clostridia bacterium]|nr:SpoIIE family protein phosphatase [Clostridia bacterium]